MWLVDSGWPLPIQLDDVGCQDCNHVATQSSWQRIFNYDGQGQGIELEENK
jgi:hypothetical protein